MFFSDQMFLSANADFFLLKVLYKWIPRLLQACFESAQKLSTIIYPKFLWLLVFDHVSTSRYLERQSIATSKYLTSRLYFASLSTWAKCKDQISFTSLTITFNRGKFNRLAGYFLKDRFVSKCILTFVISSLQSLWTSKWCRTFRIEYIQ